MAAIEPLRSIIALEANPGKDIETDNQIKGQYHFPFSFLPRVRRLRQLISQLRIYQRLQFHLLPRSRKPEHASPRLQWCCWLQSEGIYCDFSWCTTWRLVPLRYMERETWESLICQWYRCKCLRIHNPSPTILERRVSCFASHYTTHLTRSMCSGGNSPSMISYGLIIWYTRMPIILRPISHEQYQRRTSLLWFRRTGIFTMRVWPFCAVEPVVAIYNRYPRQYCMAGSGVLLMTALKQN